MGNSQTKKRDAEFSRNVDGGISSTIGRTLSPTRPPEPPPEQPRSPQPVSFKMHHDSGKVSSTKEKYALIPDNFTSIEQLKIDDAMGNSESKKRDAEFSRNVDGGISSTIGRPLSLTRPPEPPLEQPRSPQPVSFKMHHGSGKVSSTKEKYALIPDNFTSLEQVTTALRNEGLESSNLILGIDFTKSNEWTGRISFNNRSLHAIGDTPNPYEKAISIIGKTLAPFDDDNLIPCFGFGDATTHDHEVFSFHADNSSCHGFEEVLACYQKIVPNLRLSGPTSYAPVIEAAMDIVEKTHGQFHVLVIVADGQVTTNARNEDGELSPQEERTIKAIVDARSYPLSIVLVGVGDGPWEDMKRFDDKIPARGFDNFQFVNFTDIMSKNASPSAKEAAFALAALMEIPFQYKAVLELGILGNTTGRAKKMVPRPPPVPYSRSVPPARFLSNILESSMEDERNQMICAICLTNRKDLAFGCGHMTCRDCGSRLSSCPICRQRITSRLRVFAG